MHHIIFLSPHSDPEASLGELDSGGQCVYEHELALALSQEPDFKVTIFCRQNFVRPDESVLNPSCKIIRVPCGVHSQIRKEDIEAVLPEFTSRVVEILSKDNADDTMIIHGHYWDGGYVSLGLKNRWNCKLPLVWTPHSLGSVKRRKFPGRVNESLYSFIPRLTWENYTINAADFVIVSTDEEQRSVEQDYAVDSEKIRVISPGVALDQFLHQDKSEARAHFDLPQEGKILLCVGRMVRTKGYHRSIRAFAAMQNRLHEPAYLLICGGAEHPTDSDEIAYKAELRQLCNELNVADNVIFLSAQSHHSIHIVYATADIFLMSSAHEPFGLVTLEAMASALPVIADKSGGSVNIITHNRDGILTNFDDSERVASAIESLCKDSLFYERISQAASRHAKRDYDWHQKSEQFAAVYRQISRTREQDEWQEQVRQEYFLKQHFRV